MAKNNECTVAEAAKELDKKYYTVLRLIKKDKIKARKVGWFYLVNKTSLQAYKAAHN